MSDFFGFDQTRPSVVAHADWSTDPRKRWVAIALRDGNSYRLEAPQRVGDLATFFERLEGLARSGSILVGFDFPIGLPLAYARRLGLASFLDILPRFGHGEWSRFFEPANRPEEIALHRPFYPRAPGGSSRAHLTRALGIDSFLDLSRRCEQATFTRPAACPLFWILGGNQVGRASITGWRDLLAPTLYVREREVALWPFQGEIPTLLAQYRFVLAETYPAEACSHIGLPRPGRLWSKRRQSDRIALASRLIDWSRIRTVRLSASLIDAILDGFSGSNEGEDAFDAVVGLMSMVDVACGRRGSGAPLDDEVRAIEGWILGQDSTEANASASAKDPSSIRTRRVGSGRAVLNSP